MSPGPTFERVYAELKRQLREGRYRPGAPLEPAAIGAEIGASITPIRDVLHRLVGEGLVEAPQHNGFSSPRLTEMALRDLYTWNGNLLALAAAHIRMTIIGDQGTTADGSVTPATMATLFRALAEATGSREHVRAVENLNERLAPYRLVEGRLLDDVAEEHEALSGLICNPDRAQLTRGLARYHRRRIAAAPHILAMRLKQA